MEHETAVEVRAIGRAVLADMSAAWEGAWVEALAYQERNPDVLAAALQAPTDYRAAGSQMIRQFAELNPQILRTAVAHCRAVAAEFGREIVPPLREHAFVSGNEDGEASEMHDRLARLESENNELRRALRMLKALVDEVIAPPPGTTTSASASLCP